MVFKPEKSMAKPFFRVSGASAAVSRCHAPAEPRWLPPFCLTMNHSPAINQARGGQPGTAATAWDKTFGDYCHLAAVLWRRAAAQYRFSPRVRDGGRFAYRDARQRPVGWLGLTRRALVPEFLPLVLGDDHHCIFIQRIIGVFMGHGKNVCRTYRDALSAAVTCVSVNGNEKISGAVAVPVMR